MSARCIVTTLCIGRDANEYAAVSHPTLKAYASKIGADFRPITKRRWPDIHIFFEKFQIADMLGEYERLVYLDTDAVVRGTTPNLLEVVPEEKFGAARWGHRGLLDDLMKLCGETSRNWEKDGIYLNSGVMVMGRSHRAIFENKPVGSQTKLRWADEGFINWYLQYNNTPIYELPPEMNWTGFDDSDRSVAVAASKAYIIHPNGRPFSRRIKILGDAVAFWSAESRR